MLVAAVALVAGAGDVVLASTVKAGSKGPSVSGRRPTPAPGQKGPGASGHLPKPAPAQKGGPSTKSGTSHGGQKRFEHGGRSYYFHSYHRHYYGWSRYCWFPAYRCYGFYCPTQCCWYYWCGQYECFVPVEYIGTFAPTPVNTNTNTNTNVNINTNAVLPPGAVTVQGGPAQPE
jgi:hypothetical protein